MSFCSPSGEYRTRSQILNRHLRQLMDPEPPLPTIDLSTWPELVDVGSQALDLQRYDALLERV